MAMLGRMARDKGRGTLKGNSIVEIVQAHDMVVLNIFQNDSPFSFDLPEKGAQIGYIVVGCQRLLGYLTPVHPLLWLFTDAEMSTKGLLGLLGVT